MITSVEVYQLRPPNPPIYHVHLRPKKDVQLIYQEPDFRLTRLWLIAVPPEKTEPGYGCVLGELWEPMNLQREARRILFDEGYALDPADFEPAQQEFHEISQTEYDQPTLGSLRRALVALKDLWRPSHLYAPPGNDAFMQFLYKAEGLLGYDRRTPIYELKKWFPFFQSPDNRLDGVAPVLYEDRDYNEQLIDSLMDQRRDGQPLFIVPQDLDSWWTRKLQNARRAAGLGLCWMQIQDMVSVAREYRLSDGYEWTPRESEESEERQELLQERLDAYRWWADEEPTPVRLPLYDDV